VSDSTLVDSLAERLAAAHLSIAPAVVEGCASYLSLLARWNRRINLTALPLGDPVPAATLDKLIVEPLVAAELFPTSEPVWFDLGSGGGSPAIPLRIARPSGSLTMVESRDRKCAFLREAVRTLGLSQTTVLSTRFEELRPQGRVDVFHPPGGSGRSRTCRLTGQYRDSGLPSVLLREHNSAGRPVFARGRAGASGRFHIGCVSARRACDGLMFHVERFRQCPRRNAKNATTQERKNAGTQERGKGNKGRGKAGRAGRWVR
jgi:hypothetical protein